MSSAFWHQNIMELLHLKCTTPSTSGSSSLIRQDSYVQYINVRFRF